MIPAFSSIFSVLVNNDFTLFVWMSGIININDIKNIIPNTNKKPCPYICCGRVYKFIELC